MMRNSPTNQMTFVMKEKRSQRGPQHRNSTLFTLMEYAKEIYNTANAQICRLTIFNFSSIVFFLQATRNHRLLSLLKFLITFTLKPWSAKPLLGHFMRN